MNDENSNQPDKSAQVGLLGDYLKQKRIDKNYSLEKLSQKTKISVNILKSLESNDLGKLPSAAYIKGFVISYVRVLGLPIDEAINKMEATYLHVMGKPFPALNHTKLMATGTASGSKPQAPEGENPNEIIKNSDSIMANTKSMIPVLIFAAIILVFVGGYKLISSIVEKEVGGDKVTDHGPKIESSSVLANKPVDPPAPAAPETQQPSTSQAPVAPAVPAAATVPAPAPNQPKPEVKAPAFERNFPDVEFKPIRSKLFSTIADAPENNDPNILPDNIKRAFNTALQNVYIKATDGNTWLSYKIDNSPIESVIISKDNDLFLQGSEIRIFLGNVNVTKIFYNNMLIKTPNKAGVKSLIFPESSNSKFVLPLFPKAKDDILYTAEDYIKRMKLEEEELKKRQNQ